MLPFDAPHVPDKVQALIMSLASPHCASGHLLFSMVSKGWASAAARSLYSVRLALSCGVSSQKWRQKKEVERLVSLAAWLRRYGHVMGSFQLQMDTAGASEDDFMLARSQAVPGIIHALAAAGRRSGGLPLQQLRVPALGNTLPSTITQALSGCRQLRCLQLDYSYGGEDIHASGSVPQQMAAALQQLTQLTSLKLAGWLALYPHHNNLVSLDGLFSCLPSSLVTFSLGSCPKVPPGYTWSILTGSMGHLVCLQQLSLPGELQVTSSTQGHPLAQLTALTRLHYPSALSASGVALLALPNLVELQAGTAKPALVETLALEPQLRSLTCTLDGTAQACGDAVEGLTQLTHLRLRGPLSLSSWGNTEFGNFAAALYSMTGLRSLALRVELLSWVHLHLPPAVTRLEVDASRVDGTSNGALVGKTLLGMAAADDRLLEQVVLVGVPKPRQKAAREAYRKALARGQVKLVFGPGG
jgi:hypothetical protein